MSNIKTHLTLLGKPVTDKVTNFKGIVSSVCFDLYGCIMAAVNPGMAADGKLQESSWFDVARLTVTGVPVMQPPDFDAGPQAEGKQGAAEKPSTGKA